jgi:transcription antitermination factor NusG
MANWLVASIFRAAAHERLVDAGFNCYRPMYRSRIARRGRRVYVPYPLLGRFLLVEILIDWVEQFHRIKVVRDVVGILVCDEKLCVVKEHEVLELKSREDRHGFIERPPRVNFAYDQRVRIVAGPFTDHPARFRKAGEITDVVAITLFGAEREIALPVGSIVGLTAA